MNKNQNLRNSLRGSEEEPQERTLSESSDEGNTLPRSISLKWQLIYAALIFFGGFFVINGMGGSIINPFKSAVSISQPSEDLLNRMNAIMVEMGYTDLTHDELRELRSHGVTATFISNVRALGFDDLTLPQAVNLARANASSTFLAMMIELGYNLNPDEFATLRRAGVTANYTSRLNDLGFANVPVDQLIRLQTIGVSTALIERLQNEQGTGISLEEIIRYRISNQ